MTDQDLIKRIYKMGHFWNPSYPSTHGVKYDDLVKLTLDDPEVKDAVRSYQESDANLDILAEVVHGRPLNIDGDVGPITRMLAESPRCPLPDHAPPAHAAFQYNDPDLQAAVESMQRARAHGGTGSGSWPVGCYGTAGVHEVKISYDLRNMSAKQQEWWPEIKTRSHAALADVGVRLIEVPVGEKANITVYGKVLSGNVIGMAEFNGGSCGDVCFCQINPNYAPDVDMVLNLLLHENGHNWNLEHRSGNIMNPSILRTPTYWIKRVGSTIEYQDNSFPTLKKFFGGDPLDVVPTPTPAPTPAPVPEPTPDPNNPFPPGTSWPRTTRPPGPGPGPTPAPTPAGKLLVSLEIDAISLTGRVLNVSRS